jgi:hypothetical protein
MLLHVFTDSLRDFRPKQNEYGRGKGKLEREERKVKKVCDVNRQ